MKLAAVVFASSLEKKNRIKRFPPLPYPTAGRAAGLFRKWMGVNVPPRIRSLGPMLLSRMAIYKNPLTGLVTIYACKGISMHRIRRGAADSSRRPADPPCCRPANPSGYSTWYFLAYAMMAAIVFPSVIFPSTIPFSKTATVDPSTQTPSSYSRS